MSVQTPVLWITPPGHLFTATESITTSCQIVASGTNVQYSLISGSLPTGLSLQSDGTIYGMPSLVLNDVRSTFVVRAKTENSIGDRTFSINVVGPSVPEWITPSGFLNLGILGEPYVLNNQYINYQLIAEPRNSPPNTKLRYYIGNNSGKLPPGITLSLDGVLSGFVQDKLTTDGINSETGGYDTELYDKYSYDHFANLEGITSVVGIPKIYGFKVTATDGITSTSTTFSIMVTSPDIIRNSDTGNLTPLSLLDIEVVSGINAIFPESASNEDEIHIKKADNDWLYELSTSTTYHLIAGGVFRGALIFNQLYSLVDPQIGDSYLILENREIWVYLDNKDFGAVNGFVYCGDSDYVMGVTGKVLSFKENPDTFSFKVFSNPKFDFSIRSRGYILAVVGYNTSYVPPLQFINGSNLGEFRSNNNHDINTSAYDPYPSLGEVTYSITTSTDLSSQLPPNLLLDHKTGYLYGNVPYQPAYSTNYSLSISATKSYLGAVVTTTNVFNMVIKGEIESTIAWVSSNNLGSIYVGETSELSIIAEQLNSNYSIKYRLISGDLPPGLTLQRDGTISGTLGYDSSGDYTFVAEASDVYGLSATEKSFTISTIKENQKIYTKIYVKPFLPLDQRDRYQEFISNEFTFDPSFMYRYYDPNFGIQSSIKVYLEFGIEEVDLELFQNAMHYNFYRRRLHFGDVKIAQAKDAQGNHVYDLVYVDIIDNKINSDGESVSLTVYEGDRIYYPNSVDNMKYRLRSIQLSNYSTISINDNLSPKFMRTAQIGDYRPPEYMMVMPLCYVLPGNGNKILSRINISKFDFKSMDFEIDRLILENSQSSTSTKYLIFERQNILSSVPEDDVLTGPDGVILIF